MTKRHFMNHAGDAGATLRAEHERSGWGRLVAGPGALLAVVFLWRLLLLGAFNLPVPANDSFFYDGAVVNQVLHGHYANPALAPALPISGTEVFCAYPPLYQVVLLGWVTVCGPSVRSVMAFHLVLFGIYLWLLLACLRRLRVPGWAIWGGGLFLFAITFDDRPDSLAHVWGLAAVYAWVRSSPSLDPEGRSSPAWAWMMALMGILTLATSLQIGAVYGLLIGAGVFAAWSAAGGRLPVFPLAALGFVPVGLVALVMFRFPHLWAGFLEHARQTPSVSGWRLPKPSEVLKIVRTVPGILAVAAGLPCLLRARLRHRSGERALALTPEARRFAVVTSAGLVAPLTITGAALVLLTPNSVMFASQLQPLLVATCLAFVATTQAERRPVPWLLWLFVVLAGLAAVRAVGLTTWGAVCAVKDGARPSLARIEDELRQAPTGSTVVLSSAYLYQAARHADVRWIHSDWMAPADRHRTDTDWEGLTRLKPTRILLTQFDYYRRFAPLLEQLAAKPELARVTLTNTATVRTPDAIPSLQRVVQHISWAPVIVAIEWK